MEVKGKHHSEGWEWGGGENPSSALTNYLEGFQLHSWRLSPGGPALSRLYLRDPAGSEDAGLTEGKGCDHSEARESGNRLASDLSDQGKGRGGPHPPHTFLSPARERGTIRKSKKFF